MIVARRPRFLRALASSEGRFVGDLLRSETVGGGIALLAAAVALLWANVDATSYRSVQHQQVGWLDLQHWAADGALAVFFFLAGLELKREFLVGSLRRPADAAVPVVAACCGVAVPAVVFVLANTGTDNLRGWAIPAATDIAFALAVLAVIGSSLPTQLRAFLLTLAVVDDLVVIVIIAVFYTETLHLQTLLIALGAFAVYAWMQHARVRTRLIYVPLAVIAWAALHESGIHATIAGVVLGLLTRVRPDDGEQRSPAERLEHRISPVSSVLAVPFFALMSAGVTVTGGVKTYANPLVLGVVLGLVLGKPVGILGGTWLVTRFTRAELDSSVTWRDVLGVSVLGGIGFTVSLLVTELSFDDVRQGEAKAAVLVGSLVSALLATAILRRSNRRHAALLEDR
ncbi:MAG TPA: Na+/H+ antiporter NhaA [Marmoricola sp.]|jgi:NhaA family Na+:H+ antiporter|nr:Na+/H+ antiporter NhaA [Marmoricola sp.]